VSDYDPIAAKAAVDSARLALALGAVALLAWSAVAETRAWRGRRLRDALLAALATASVAGWWHFGHLHYGGPERPQAHIHTWDAYHYYIGAKYFEELRYDGLYECTCAADLESDDWQGVARRLIRDLDTNQLVRVTPLATSSCKERFSAERWQRFSEDVAWFRARLPQWDQVFHDWGFNATPPWIAVGGPLTSTGPATAEQLTWLTLLDVPLLAIGFASVAWAFGWRMLCILLIFFGTNAVADYSWTGGSILRYAWFASLLGGISLLRRGYCVSAGALLATATLLRVFPGVTFFGLALLGVRRMVVQSDRAALARTWRIAAGAVGTIAVVVPLAAPGTGGLEAWAEFTHNSMIDTAPSPNHVGLTGIVGYREQDKWEILKGLPNAAARWERGRQQTLNDRRVVRILGIAIGAAILAVSALRRPDQDWAAASIALGLVPIAFHLAGYYQISIVTFGLLASQRRPWIGVALCALAAASLALHQLEAEPDEIHLWISYCWIGFVLFCGAAWRAPPRRPPGSGLRYSRRR
jgi:hypothetical protein